ncbi:hypothetical protein C8R44DRAFT_973047 [Mycena epipterygia]|nr:hypothetical protein C8R44DRAFT_973047 [Mycena epipterygia]
MAGSQNILSSITAAAPCLLRMFPYLEPSTITAVLNHTLHAHDLYLLDAGIRDIEPTYTFNCFTSSFGRSTAGFRAFLLQTVYSSRCTPNSEFYSLTTPTRTLAADYTCQDAVRQYRTLFFNRPPAKWKH